MTLLIQNGEIVTDGKRFKADVRVEGETIAQIGEHLSVPEGATVIDASGKFVFPGFIDPHVHIHLPFMGTFAKDTHATGSQAALIGGTTTFIEMLAPAGSEDLMDGWRTWTGMAEGNSACDYSFHIGVTRWDERTEATLRELVGQGMKSFKVFLAYKGAFGIDDHALYQVCRLAAELGVVVTAHCENADLVAELQQKLLAEGKTGPEWHEPSRPESVEAEGTAHFATFVEMTGARGYVVHLSNARALQAALDARARGVKLDVEVVIPHLTLDRTYAERPGVEGAKYVMSPPLREKGNQPKLWAALERGDIATVATDHCPFDVDQKRMGDGNFTKIPNGIPAIEDRVNVLYTQGVSRGNLSLERFVDAASTRAAQIFGLYPRKGSVQVGADADLVIYDPAYRGAISAQTSHMNNDYSGFEGWEIDGRPEVVTVRGQIAVQGGEFVGDPARGQLLRR
ncbi:dihydropyrimidinase [Deinococcus soli (ex Cha et al. 2016)]|uniref:Dihydropyrimidinase n=2 Tax=Deinococcus soli (ex Cha et al. 2016) TaxID=1309411 RepID=A0ACC6KE98_9DEIO|nr:dihydropyrimidinase [Deinococcus soli (ex Cha et al. 2016)]MDR6217775.1 dihydropyrimidinase [Deinococcus soli (ex Cha et al. 2016)]MDR6328025.1 dihydropyrimidinase [Deinococcus soli (ex Cha et al. 2016)]MDR6750877.1 dihydropyrimidinase [Deinococcus soli (ex Cha et al. 2016)]